MSRYNELPGQQNRIRFRAGVAMVMKLFMMIGG